MFNSFIHFKIYCGIGYESYLTLLPKLLICPTQFLKKIYFSLSLAFKKNIIWPCFSAFTVSLNIWLFAYTYYANCCIFVVLIEIRQFDIFSFVFFLKIVWVSMVLLNSLWILRSLYTIIENVFRILAKIS